MNFLINDMTYNMGTESAFAVLVQAQQRQAMGHDMIALSIGQPDFKTPDHIVKAAHKALDDQHFGYSPAKGIPPLRETIADYVERYWQWQVSTDRILVMPGGKPTIFFACMLLGGKRKDGARNHIIIPDPGFPIYGSAAKYSGARVTGYALHEELGFGFRADEILSQITDDTSLLILNSPGNPTGGCFGKDELTKLAEGLKKHPNLVILSDEIYRFMCYAPYQHHSLIDFAHLRDRIILLDGCSKTFAMTGWRLGFGVWPEALVEHVEKLAVNNHSCVNNIAQYAAIAAFSGPMDFFDDYMAQFQKRRDLLVDSLNDMDGVQCALPLGAFYAFANFKAINPDCKIIQQRIMEEANVATIAGRDFGDAGAGYIRFSYAAAYDDIGRALERIKNMLKN